MSVGNGAHVSRGVVGLQKGVLSGWLLEPRTWSARDIIVNATTPSLVNQHLPILPLLESPA